MTEQEARTKWCPMARVSTYSVGNPAESAANRTDEGTPYPASRCIASDCMMWRWDGDEKEYTFTKQWEDGWEYEPYRSEVTLQLNDRWARSNHSRKGHCGLGGKP